eukprot:216501_1
MYPNSTAPLPTQRINHNSDNTVKTESQNRYQANPSNHGVPVLGMGYHSSSQHRYVQEHKQNKRKSKHHAAHHSVTTTLPVSVPPQNTSVMQTLAGYCPIVRDNYANNMMNQRQAPKHGSHHTFKPVATQKAHMTTTLPGYYPAVGAPETASHMMNQKRMGYDSSGLKHLVDLQLRKHTEQLKQQLNHQHQVYKQQINAFFVTKNQEFQNAMDRRDNALRNEMRSVVAATCYNAMQGVLNKLKEEEEPIEPPPKKKRKLG